jgi:hypothetical protein
LLFDRFEQSQTPETDFQYNSDFIELQSILDSHCDSYEEIDETLRAYLRFTTNYKGQFAPELFSLSMMGN